MHRSRACGHFGVNNQPSRPGDASRYPAQVLAIYPAHERFTAHDDAWQKYVEWLGRNSATEITTFDGMLCSLLIDDPDHAYRIAETIRVANPEEHHCRDCRVWGIAGTQTGEVPRETQRSGSAGGRALLGRLKEAD